MNTNEQEGYRVVLLHTTTFGELLKRISKGSPFHEIIKDIWKDGKGYESVTWAIHEKLRLAVNWIIAIYGLTLFFGTIITIKFF